MTTKKHLMYSRGVGFCPNCEQRTPWDVVGTEDIDPLVECLVCEKTYRISERKAAKAN